MKERERGKGKRGDELRMISFASLRVTRDERSTYAKCCECVLRLAPFSHPVACRNALYHVARCIVGENFLRGDIVCRHEGEQRRVSACISRKSGGKFEVSKNILGSSFPLPFEIIYVRNYTQCDLNSETMIDK